MELTTETLELINNIKLDEIDIKGFEDFLMKLSVELDVADDAKPILFSGCINDMYTGEIVGNIEGVRYIGKTQIGTFMSSEKSQKIIIAALNNELKKAHLM